MKRELDTLLKQALAPEDEPDFRLNQKIITQMKEKDKMGRKKRKFQAAAAAIVCVLALSSVTAYAAWKYLSPSGVAEKVENQKLRDAFLSEDAITINETQRFRDYHVTLLGMVSGKNISEYLDEDSDAVEPDKTYTVTAIERTDGAPMPDTGDENYGQEPFLVTPLLRGYDPGEYNIFTMGGGYAAFVQDGIEYRLTECDNIEIFADTGVLLSVSSGTFFEREAYDFDESTGKITRNVSYDGVNALFEIPVDESKADPEAAKALIRRLDDERMADSEEPEATEIDAWVQKLTPENIDEYAKPLEETVQVLTPDEEGYVSVSYHLESGAGLDGIYAVSELFDDGKEGMCPDFGYSYSDDRLESLLIDTFTLNADGTITFAVYVPK